MKLNTKNFLHVLCMLYFLYTTADSDAYDNIKGRVSTHAKASYFDTMPRMDTSWKKAPKKVTAPLTVNNFLPLVLRNGPTGSPYFEGLSYFAWCFAVTYVTFRFLWYLKLAIAKRGYGIKVVKMKGKNGFFLVLLMASMVIIFALTGMAFTVATMEIYRNAGHNGKVAVFNVATTAWNKLDIIASELGQMATFLEDNPNVGDGMTKEKAENLQKIMNNDKDVLDTDKYDKYIKQMSDKLPPKYEKYTAIVFFALLAVFGIITIFRNQWRVCVACKSTFEPLWYIFMVFLMVISTFTIFGNDLCKDDDAVGIVTEEVFKAMYFDEKTSNLMGAFYKYYFLCDGKTDHPLTNLMKLDAGTTRNLGEDNPLDGTLLGGLLSDEEAVAINQMLKEKPDMKENLDNSDSFFKKNPKLEEKLKEAKNLDEMMDLTEEIANRPDDFKGLLIDSETFNKPKLEFVMKQMHLMSQMAQLRVSTDCKNFDVAIKKAKQEACDGLNAPVMIIIMIMTLMTMDFVVIIVQNVYSWCQSKRSEEPEQESIDQDQFVSGYTTTEVTEMI